jgi:hypothetical protein
MWIGGMLVGCTFGLAAYGPESGGGEHGAGGVAAIGAGKPGAQGAGDGAASDGTSGDGTSGDGTSGDGTAGDGTAGDGTTDTAGSPAGSGDDTATGPADTDGTPADTASPDPSAGARPPEPGELLINELMITPDDLDEDEAQWIELLNVGSAPLLLDGLVVTDGVETAFMISSTVALAPGAVFVLANARDPAHNGGIVPDYTYDPLAFRIGDPGEQVLLRRGDLLLDKVDLGGGFPDERGASASLDPGHATPAGNDAPGAWCPGSTPYGTGDNFGTPGGPNPRCP